jgi:hypothetical protein
MSNATYAQPAVSDYRAYNQQFLKAVKSGAQGIEKVASMLNDQIVLTVLREDGLFRRAFSTIPITNADLDFDFANPDIPTKFEAIESPLNTYLVHTTDYLQPQEDLWFKSTYFKIRFHPMVSRKIRMPESQILAAKYPIRQYLEAQIKNDFLAVEDFQMIDRFERCISETGLSVTADPTDGLLKKEHIMNLAKLFPPQRLSANQIILHENTFYDIIAWQQTEVGSVIMADIVEKGVMGESLKYKSYLGFKWLITNNSDIVPEKVLYATVPQRMLGVSYELQGPETYVEFRDGVLSIHSRQILGRAIANARGVAKIIIT